MSSLASASSAHGGSSEEEASPAASPNRPQEDDNVINVDPEILGEDSSVPLTQNASTADSAGDPAMEEEEEGEINSDENYDDFTFRPFKISFPADFKRHAKHAAEFGGVEMPEPVPLPNADIIGGEAFGLEEEAVDIRYPEAHNHYRAFERAFTNVGVHNLATALGKCSEATKIPGFKEMMEAGIPRPENDVASHLSDSTVVLQKDKQGRVREIPFPKDKPTYETSRKFADDTFKAAVQIGALNNSTSLLNTAAEKMLRVAASPPGEGMSPTGLPPRFCQTIYDYMQLNACIGISIAQTAGYMAALSVVHTRKLWMDFVKLDKNKASTIKLESITHADIDKTGLFGPGLEHILSRQEDFIERRPAFEEVLPRDRSRAERSRPAAARPRENNDQQQQRRDRSPQRQDRPARQPTAPRNNNNTARGQQRGGRDNRRRFWAPGPRPSARDRDNSQRRGEECGGERARAQQQRTDQRQSFFGAPSAQQ